MKTINLLICGGGSDAHAFAGIASSREGIEVRVLSLYQDEAERWSSALQTTSVEVELQRSMFIKHDLVNIFKMIILRNKSHGEIIRVCMEMFTTALRIKTNAVKFSIAIPHLTFTVHCLLFDRLLC